MFSGNDSPCFENPNLTSCNFSPPEPHQSVAQKVLKHDVPDISVISDNASEAGSAVYSKTFGSRTAFSRIPKYHQTSPRSTSGFHKTSVISTESENPNHVEKMYDPIPNQCRLVKYSHKPRLNIDSHEVLTSLSRQRSPVSILPDECNNSSEKSFNRAEEEIVSKVDHCSFKNNLHHDGLLLQSQNICGTDTFDNSTGSNEQLSGDIISDINSDLNLRRKPPHSICVPSCSTIPFRGEHHSIQSPHYECVTEDEVDFNFCANNQPVLSQSRMPFNRSIPEYVDKFSRHSVSHTDKCRESKGEENAFIPSENTNKQIVSSVQFQNKCSCCVKSSSVSSKRTIGASSLNSISATDVENVNKCLIEKPEIDVWKYLKEQDKKLHNLQNQISLFLQQKESCCSAGATEQKSRCIPGHKTSLDMELSQGLSEDNQYEINPNQSFILRYLKEHNDQIHRLQDQVDLLLRRTEELVSFHSERDKSRSTPEPIPFSDNKCDSSLKEPNFDSEDDAYQVNGDAAAVVCQEQTQVKKTSTSTMTSLTFEGSDKLVYRKMLTVVTGFSNCQKDVSVQSSQRKSSPASDTQAKTDKHTPKSKKEMIQKNGYSNTTPKSAGFKKQDQKSQKRSLNKSKKTNQELHHQNGPINLNGDNNANLQVLSPQFRASNDKCSSPLFDSDRENKLVKEFRSPDEKILPLYENVKRNIKALISKKDDQNDPEPSPSGTKHLQKSSGHPNACKTKSPHAILSPPKRKVEPRRSSSRSSSASSNNSIDSFYGSPQPRFEESSTISCYGCSSPNLSLATKQYLEKNGLVGRRSSSHNDDSERMSSKKSRTPACRRQLR